MTAPRYAASVLDVGTLPLRRRDRAALVLAYECIRRGYDTRCTWTSAQKASRCGTMLFDAYAAFTAGRSVLCYAMRDALPSVFDLRDADSRLLRARLALAIRVLLRCDGYAGESYGIPQMWWYLEKGQAHPALDDGTMGSRTATRLAKEYEGTARPFAPLWDSLARDGRSP